MGSWSEQQAGIDQQNHGCSAAKDYRTNADPAQALKREPLADDIRE